MSERSVRIIIDFPNMPRRAYSRPDAVLHAHTLDEVRPVLQAAQDAAQQGSTVIGFVSYEAAPAFDLMPIRPPATPLAWFSVFSESGDAEFVQPCGSLDWRFASRREDVVKAVTRIRQEIAAGTTYQVNYTTRLFAEFEGDPHALYEAMRASQGDGYHALIETDEFAVVSASPELFFEVEGRRIRTRPMKGTRPRGRWVEEDEALALELSDSEKDRAENLMIVDLLRNDMGRIAEYGTVHPISLFDIEQYRTVHQMTSTIEGQLRRDVTITDVFEALFPCGSVTGAPKISTMRLIDELEDAPRGVYCGAIGVMEKDRAVFNVAIRTAYASAGRATFGTGAGITFDSDADAEYEEMVAKSRVLMEPWADFALLETMRAEDGNVVRLQEHLDRLRASAVYFDYTVDETAIEHALNALPSGVQRVRLTSDRDGRVEVECRPLDVVENPTFLVGPAAIDTQNRFLYHKTTWRPMYETLPGAWETLHCNTQGEVTEFTRGNVVMEIGGTLFTPPLESGILPGVFRAELIRSGVVRERVLTPGDVKQATRVWLVNSLREWLELRLCENST